MEPKQIVRTLRGISQVDTCVCTLALLDTCGLNGNAKMFTTRRTFVKQLAKLVQAFVLFSFFSGVLCGIQRSQGDPRAQPCVKDSLLQKSLARSPSTKRVYPHLVFSNNSSDLGLILVSIYSEHLRKCGCNSGVRTRQVRTLLN